MDLLFLMVKRKKYFLNPISRQNFANAFAETPNLNLEVRHKLVKRDEKSKLWSAMGRAVQCAQGGVSKEEV